MSFLVEGISGYAYRVSVGGHELVVDQGKEGGGEDLGPTPTDLFVAGLASCAAYYAGRFLARRGVPTRAIRATCDYRIATGQPARVEWITVSLDLPPGLTDEARAGAIRAAEHCTVHNSLVLPPTVTIALRKMEAVA